MRKKKPVNMCMGISNIVRIKRHLYFNLFFDTDNVKDFVTLGNFLNHFNTNYETDFIVIKSGNRKNGYHIVCPQIFHKNDAIVFFHLFKHELKELTGYEIDNFDIEKSLKIKYRLKSGKKILMGSVLRISKKNENEINVLGCYIKHYKLMPKRKISIDLLDIYKKYGLDNIDYTNLLNTNGKQTRTKYRFNLYFTGG